MAPLDTFRRRLPHVGLLWGASPCPGDLWEPFGCLRAITGMKGAGFVASRFLVGPGKNGSLGPSGGVGCWLMVRWWPSGRGLFGWKAFE